MDRKDAQIKKLATAAALSVVLFAAVAIGTFIYFFGGAEERETLEIPRLVGKSLDGIGETDHIIIEPQPIFSDSVPKGEIISQFPCGGAKRKRAAGERITVRVNVSLGKETETVPDLMGFKYTDAAAALRRLGAGIRIVSVYDDTAESGIVKKTSPESGKSIERGDRVTLFVSRKHIRGAISVRDYVGKGSDAACGEILAQGLTLGEITREYSDEFREGVVTYQSIAPDSLVRHGSRIDIRISMGKEKEELHPFGRYTVEETER